MIWFCSLMILRLFVRFDLARTWPLLFLPLSLTWYRPLCRKLGSLGSLLGGTWSEAVHNRDLYPPQEWYPILLGFLWITQPLVSVYLMVSTLVTLNCSLQVRLGVRPNIKYMSLSECRWYTDKHIIYTTWRQSDG